MPEWTIYFIKKNHACEGNSTLQSCAVADVQWFYGLKGSLEVQMVHREFLMLYLQMPLVCASTSPLSSPPVSTDGPQIPGNPCFHHPNHIPSSEISTLWLFSLSLIFQPHKTSLTLNFLKWLIHFSLFSFSKAVFTHLFLYLHLSPYFNSFLSFPLGRDCFSRISVFFSNSVYSPW